MCLLYCWCYTFKASAGPLGFLPRQGWPRQELREGTHQTKPRLSNSSPYSQLAQTPNSFDTTSHQHLLCVHQHSIALEEGSSFKIRVFQHWHRIVKVWYPVLLHPRRVLTSPATTHYSLQTSKPQGRFSFFFWTVPLIEFHICYQTGLPNQVLLQEVEADAEPD